MVTIIQSLVGHGDRDYYYFFFEYIQKGYKGRVAGGRSIIVYELDLMLTEGGKKVLLLLLLLMIFVLKSKYRGT